MIFGVTQASMHIPNADLHFSICHLLAGLDFHSEPRVKTSSWSLADLLLVNPHSVRKAWGSTAWHICYCNDLIFQRCSLNGAYMAKENANSVQRKPSLSLLYDPEWLHRNGPIWSIQQGLEEVREKVWAESERWRPSSWECFQSTLCRFKTMHVFSISAHHTYTHQTLLSLPLSLFFSVSAFRLSNGGLGCEPDLSSQLKIKWQPVTMVLLVPFSHQADGSSGHS